jgi:hypothetical protein
MAAEENIDIRNRKARLIAPAEHQPEQTKL